MIAHSDTFTPSPLRRIFCSLFFVAAGIAALGAIGSSRATDEGSPSATASKIDPWVIEHTANDQHAELMVVLVDQADLRPAAALATKNEKSRYVHDALWNKSQAAQGPILQWLRERGLEHRSFYIINSILIKGSREVAEALAARPDVARIEGNPQIQNVLPQPITTVEAPSQSETPDAIEPNINYTHAPQVWARGFTGRGLVIGTADTGVRWTHNALKSHYRGWNATMANHNYNWHDSVHNGAGNPCGNNAQAPCDDNGHGTHTIGTAIGDDGMGNQIGMAALAELETARQTLPNDSRLYELAGYIERRRPGGNHEEALRNLKRAIDLDPRNTFLLRQTAFSYDDLRRYAEEEAVLDRALSIDPGNAGLKVARARVDYDSKAANRSKRFSKEMRQHAGQWVTHAELDQN